jgi:hypothetical protein
MGQAMDTWVAELLNQIDLGRAIDPVEMRQLLEHKEGRRQLRQYLAMRQLLAGWTEDPPAVSGEKPPLPISLEQLKTYLEQGTLNNDDLDESAERLLSAGLFKPRPEQTPPDE